MTTPINIWPMVLLILLSIFLSVTPIAVVQDSQIAKSINDEVNGFDVIMGTAGDEIMLDDTFLGTAWIYPYASRDGMQEACDALTLHLTALGYTTAEAALERLPATRFAKDGEEDILFAPHTDYSFVYVLVGKFVTNEEYAALFAPDFD